MAQAEQSRPHLWRPGIFTRALGDIESARDLALHLDPAISLAELVVELRLCKQIAAAAADLVHAAEATLAAAMPDRKVVVEEEGVTLVRSKQSRRTFDSPDLVVGRVRRWALEGWAVDQARLNGTGELVDPSPEVEAAAEAVTQAITMAARLEFRTTALQDMGIDPDRYSKLTFGRPVVQLVGPQR